VVLVLSACAHHGDENLGLGGKNAQVDLARLTDPEVLLRALSLSGKALDELLGAHRMDASAVTKLTLQGPRQATLEDTFLVQSDAHGAVHVLHDNSRGNGFEAVALNEELYVKPRYGKFVRRRVEADEVERLRAAAETNAAADLRLLSRFLIVREAGDAEVAGHAGKKLSLTAKTAPGPSVPESESGRRWRESVDVRYIDGDVILDKKTGVPLTVRIEASYTFVRDGKPLWANLSYKQTTSADVGPIAAPVDCGTIGRVRPMLDRQTLLEGLK
jgi:hypothetical protein